jgi:ribose 5-phosphate isomerase A
MSGSAGTPEASARAALEFVSEGQTLGLGTGRAAEAFVRALGGRVAEGLEIRGVPTSERTAALAEKYAIPLLSLAEAKSLDICFDGADEVDAQLDVIKGYGGALVREKIVAASSEQLVILIGAEKLVGRLGERGKLPIEVIPFAESLVGRRLEELGCPAECRRDERGETFVSDNGNLILDCRVEAIAKPNEFEQSLLAIPGVVGTGLFLGMANAVIVQHGDRVEVRRR